MATVAPFLEGVELLQDALIAMRKQAWTLFEKRGLPTKEEEAFRYFPVRAFRESPLVLAKQGEMAEIDPYILPECKENYIVFIDGHFCPALSRSRIGALPLSEAMRTYGHFLRARLTKILETETDPFALLNSAFHPSGAFFYLPPKTVLGPLQVLFIATEPAVSLPRFQVFAGAHASAEIYITNVGVPESLVIPALDFALEENSHVRLHHIAETDLETWYLSSLSATLKKAANFSYIQWKKGKGIMRNRTRVWLQGAEARADLKGVWMLQEKAQTHLHVRVDHEAPHTQSTQLFKGVLADLSQSSFEGKIYVRPEAQKTQAYQLNKNLLLSPHTSANVKPNLEIFADDVKASHGATVAHLDEEILFYLKTRGIGPSVAKRLLVEGFCREILGDLALPSLTNQALHVLDRYLS